MADPPIAPDTVPDGPAEAGPAASAPAPVAPAPAGGARARPPGRHGAPAVLPGVCRRAHPDGGHHGRRRAGAPAGVGRRGERDPQPGRRGRTPRPGRRRDDPDPERPDRVPDAVPRGRRGHLPHRPAPVARRARRVPVPIGRGGLLRDPRDDRPWRPGDRPGRRDRAGDGRRAAARRAPVRAQGDHPRLGQRADQRPADRGQPALGGRPGRGPVRRGRRAQRRRPRDRGRHPRRGRCDRVRGHDRPRPAGGLRAGGPAGPRRPPGPDPHPLQHRAAGLRPVRHGPRCHPGGAPRRPRGARPRRRDAPVPAGCAADDLGAGPGRRPAFAPARRGGRAPDGHRRGRRRAGRRRSGGGQRRHRQQGRDLPAGRPGGPPWHPVLRLRPDQLGRPHGSGRRGDPDRGAQPRRGPRVPRRPHRAGRHRGPQPRLRHHAGRAHHRVRDRGGADHHAVDPGLREASEAALARWAAMPGFKAHRPPPADTETTAVGAG